MKFVWIGALLLIFASVANLISNRQSGRLIEESWKPASHVLGESKLLELQRAVPAYTANIFARFPEPFREKLAGKTRQPLELMVLRFLLLCGIIPAFLFAAIAGLLEGFWARANQRGLVKIHSPMRFGLAMMGLGFMPVLALLWITAPIAVPPTLLVFTVGVVVVISTRNLVVHAPTRF
jgi:hypothetical protein